MKLHKPMLKRLDSRGVSHLLVPLVVVVALAVGGAYMLVAKNAQNASARVAATHRSKGVIMVYNNNDPTKLYKSVKVEANGNFKCSGVVGGVAKLQTSDAVDSATKAQKFLLPKKLTCDVTSGTEKYTIGYKNDDGSLDPRIAVTVLKGYCTQVYPDASKSSMVLLKNGSCPSTARATTYTHFPVNMNIQPDAFKKTTKRITGKVDLYIDSTAFSVSQQACSGSIRMTATPEGGSASVQRTYPVRLVHGKKGAKGYQARNFCRAIFNNLAAAKNFDATKKYTLNVSYTGSYILEPQTGTASTKPFTVKATSKKKHVTGSPQPAAQQPAPAAPAE